MFLGLLKKAYEQTEFDKNNFFYSEWELAFLTLWSTLNELQEVYYEKTQPNLVFVHRGTTYSHHVGRKNQSPITYLNSHYKKHFRWTYKSEVFLDYEYKLKIISDNIQIKNDFILTSGTQKSFLKYETSTGQYSLYSTLENTPVDYEDKLHLQIGFILLKINANINLMQNLDFLNKKIRNKHYLTHGEDSLNTNFSKLYQEQRENIDWQKNIEHLFEIVYFLCTGKECDWNAK